MNIVTRYVRPLRSWLVAFFCRDVETNFLFQLVAHSVTAFTRDECMMRAAAIAYYAVLSLFPLVLGLIAVFSMFAEPAEVQGRIIRMVTSYLPGS